MNKKTGFTLVELLAVVLIIAILTSVALPQYRRAIQRTQATEALTNLRTIFDSAMRYRAANSENPKNAQKLDVNFFEATHNDTDHYSKIGFFKYNFNTDKTLGGVEACLLEGTNESTFCLWMRYKKSKECNVDFGPGTIFCTKKGGNKYAYVCPHLGKKINDACSIYVIE
ncbi:MAG: type II secretion system protein [Elusimicrobiaceae bacterium]|nr:type II secretion system protein [Elusimicrobiaceae bacterium]